MPAASSSRMAHALGRNGACFFDDVALLGPIHFPFFFWQNYIYFCSFFKILSLISLIFICLLECPNSLIARKVFECS